jgi:hypothetical protein
VNLWRDDPGPCIVCGAPHSACSATSGPVIVVQLPATVAAALRVSAPEPAPVVGPFTTGTYRGRKTRTSALDGRVLATGADGDLGPTPSVIAKDADTGQEGDGPTPQDLRSKAVTTSGSRRAPTAKRKTDL